MRERPGNAASIDALLLGKGFTGTRFAAGIGDLRGFFISFDIDDDEYVRREAELMTRLRDVRAWRERLGKSTSGGPVRVARDAGEG